jgi:hypothetical protein
MMQQSRRRGDCPTGSPGLSKSRYLAGLQCAKQLWWKAHEPDAPELVPDADTQRIFDRGSRVGELARTYVPGGVLIDLPHYAIAERVAATQRALADGARVVYEASFREDGVFVSVDILERRERRDRSDEFVLTEVKSTLDVKAEHMPDVAIQLHVLRRAGLSVSRAELMHLNRACRFPDLSNLFVRTSVTRQLGPWLADAPARIAALRAQLAGALPDVAPGPHCSKPYECPFVARCQPPLPAHHVSTLYRLSADKWAALEAAGCATLLDVPPSFAASDIQRRQIESVQAGVVVAAPGLSSALADLQPPLAFLDFETINPAIPVWPGCAPYQQVPVQFSCHRVARDGAVRHATWLADGPGDPRRGFAEALLAACDGAHTVVAYNAPFEKRFLRELATALPDLAPALEDVAARTEDLLKIVRDHLYHPEFAGSFSLKAVLPALVPALGYDELEIQDGGTAAAALESLLLEPDAFDEAERRALRADLEAYCALDTWALVQLAAALRKLSGAEGSA